MKTIIFCVTMVVFNDIYVTCHTKITKLKPEEINPPEISWSGLPGTIICEVSGLHSSRTTHCKTYGHQSELSAQSKSTKLSWYDKSNHFVGRRPIETSSKRINCANVYDVTMLCASSSLHLRKYFTCKVKCSAEGLYMIESDESSLTRLNRFFNESDEVKPIF